MPALAAAAFLRVRLAGAGVSEPALSVSAGGGVLAAALGAVVVVAADGGVDGVDGVGGPAGRLADRRRRLTGLVGSAPVGLSLPLRGFDALLSFAFLLLSFALLLLSFALLLLRSACSSLRSVSSTCTPVRPRVRR
ncbi:MAG TPA: hypothetical protein VGG23_01315 [Acidimicrobiales bacterium]